MQRQLALAVGVAQGAKLDGARILGIGCGTGWLENGLLSFGEVWGTDLSAAAIELNARANRVRVSASSWRLVPYHRDHRGPQGTSF